LFPHCTSPEGKPGSHGDGLEEWLVYIVGVNCEVVVMMMMMMMIIMMRMVVVVMVVVAAVIVTLMIVSSLPPQ